MSPGRYMRRFPSTGRVAPFEFFWSQICHAVIAEVPSIPTFRAISNRVLKMPDLI